MGSEWFLVDQPDARFRAEGRHVVGPFYAARVVYADTGVRVPLVVEAPLTGRSSVRRAVTYGIQRELRRRGLYVA